MKICNIKTDNNNSKFDISAKQLWLKSNVTLAIFFFYKYINIYSPTFLYKKIPSLKK